MLPGLVVGAREGLSEQAMLVDDEAEFGRIHRGGGRAGALGGRGHNVRGEGSGNLAQECSQPWPPVKEKKAGSTGISGAQREGDIQLIFPDFSFLHAGGPPTLRTMQRPGLWGYMDLEMAVTRVTGWLTRTRDLRLPESHADLVDLGTSLHSVSHSARSLTPVLPALRQHPRLRPNPCKQTPR